MKAFIAAETPEALKELSGAAYRLGYRVEVLAFDATAEDVDGINYAEKIWLIRTDDVVMFEDYTDTVAALVNNEKPDLVLVQSSKRCKLMAGRLAALLSTSAMTDVMEIDQDGVIKRLVYGGTAIRREKSATSMAIVTVGAGILEKSPEPYICEAEIEEVQFIQPQHKMKCVKKEQKPKVSVNLNAAKRVIGVGRGIVNEADLVMVNEFAKRIDGEVGCTRPIAEGEKWMPRETYIGVSGLMLVPEIYISLGVSGQVQHMVGVNQAKVVISVNKDKNAPVFKQSDYGIVGDLYKVLPALIERWK